DVSRKFTGWPIAHVARRMHCAGGNEENFASAHAHGWLASDLIVDCARENVNDLFTGMGVRRPISAGREIDARLNHLAPSCTEVVALQIVTAEPGHLRVRAGNSQNSSV